MDIMKMITELVDKIKADPKLIEKFQKDPVSTVEKLLGVDLPNDQLDKVVDGIKAKISVDKLGDALGGISSILGKK